MIIEINNYQFTLLHERALFKNDERLLIIADIHLGKASHFRKEGISIPAKTQLKDYENLAKLFRRIEPLKVYFLGDLFHSSVNIDWQYFCDLVAQFPDIEFTLIKGNHDIIDKKLFSKICVQVVDVIEDNAFVYSHDELKRVPKGKVNIVGHIHPGITLSGYARQSIKLPCFYMEGNVVILPAFGTLTGLYSMVTNARSRVYIVFADKIERVL